MVEGEGVMVEGGGLMVDEEGLMVDVEGLVVELEPLGLDHHPRRRGGRTPSRFALPPIFRAAPPQPRRRRDLAPLALRDAATCYVHV